MLVVLDPGFFREAGLQSTVSEEQAAALGRLRLRLEDANRLIALAGNALVLGLATFNWFDEVYGSEARKLEGLAPRPLKQALDRFREHRRKGRVLAEAALAGKMWGLPMMADWPGFERSWRQRLERVLAASVVAAATDREKVVFLCHRIPGRNVRDRSSGGVELIEVLRWRLSASITGAPPTIVPCVGRIRHLEVPWTVRMDDRLPGSAVPGDRSHRVAQPGRRTPRGRTPPGRR